MRRQGDGRTGNGVVLVGTSVSRAGETSICASKAITHLVEVEQVLKGNPGEGFTHTPAQGVLPFLLGAEIPFH